MISNNKLDMNNFNKILFLNKKLFHVFHDGNSINNRIGSDVGICR